MCLTHTTTFRVVCAECGGEFSAQRSHAKFCTPGCRKVFNNRRASRGAELYDFLMGKRFDRGEGNEAECRAILDSLAHAYRTSDNELRDGRKSWLPRRQALDALARLPAVADGR